LVFNDSTFLFVVVIQSFMKGEIQIIIERRMTNNTVVVEGFRVSFRNLPLMDKGRVLTNNLYSSKVPIMKIGIMAVNKITVFAFLVVYLTS